MPPHLTAATGLDALCHAIEAYVSTEAEPISDAMCLYAIRMIGDYKYVYYTCLKMIRRGAFL